MPSDKWAYNSIIRSTILSIFLVFPIAGCIAPGVIVPMISPVRNFSYDERIYFISPVQQIDKVTENSAKHFGFHVSGRSGTNMTFSRATGLGEQFFTGKIERFTLVTQPSSDQKSIRITAVVIGNLGTADENKVKILIKQMIDKISDESGVGIASVDQPTSENDQRPCALNFEKSGNQQTGQKFSTFSQFDGANKTSIFEKILSRIAFHGYQIGLSDKNAGVISSSGSVSGSNRTFPFNASIRPYGSSIRVELVMSLSGGLTANESEIKEEFCDIIDSAT